MKRLIILTIVVFLLVGCSEKDSAVDDALLFLKQIADGNGCSFNAIITADYGNKLYQFSMQCSSDATGNITFSIIEPESIRDITGKISNERGVLTFDDQALAFEMIADGQITPVSSVWLFMRALHSGYIRSYETKDDLCHLVINDSYQEKAMQLDIYLTKKHAPIQADILWNNRRIITIQVENFTIL